MAQNLEAIAEQGTPQARMGSGLDSVLGAPIRLVQGIRTRIGATADYSDSFLSSFLRNATRNYVFTTGVYMALANPIVGIPYMFLGPLFAKYTINTAYNAVRGTLGLLMKPVLHPIDFVKGIFGKAGNPLGAVKQLFTAPWEMIKYAATTEKQNKHGKLVGGIAGITGGIFSMSGDVLGELGNKISDYSQSMLHGISDKMAYASAKYVPTLAR